MHMYNKYNLYIEKKYLSTSYRSISFTQSNEWFQGEMFELCSSIMVSYHLRSCTFEFKNIHMFKNT